MRLIRFLYLMWIILRVGWVLYFSNSFSSSSSSSKKSRIAKFFFFLFKKRGSRKEVLMFLRQKLLTLGVPYIKFGQFIAARSDIIGVIEADIFSSFYDNVAPFPTFLAEKTLDTALRQSYKNIFSPLDAPIASASIAQVYRASILASSQIVALKILRPNILKECQTCFKTLHFCVAFLSLFSKEARRLRLSDTIKLFESTTTRELDLSIEAANLSLLKESFEKISCSVYVYIPEILWVYTSSCVLVTSFIENYLPLSRQPLTTSHPVLAQRLMTVFLKQVLYEGVFYADFHPGNIFIFPGDTFGLVDGGIIGSIDEDCRFFLGSILYGFVKRDYKKVAQLHFQAGYVPATEDTFLFEQALRAVGETIFGRPSSNVSMGALLGLLFQITKQFHMQTQLSLVLLQKTMLMVEGMCARIDENHNPWDTAKPVLEEWMRSILAPHRRVERFLKRITKNTSSRFFS